jgi:monovalent cation/hydrogen antiporter
MLHVGQRLRERAGVQIRDPATEIRVIIVRVMRDHFRVAGDPGTRPGPLPDADGPLGVPDVDFEPGYFIMLRIADFIGACRAQLKSEKGDQQRRDAAYWPPAYLGGSGVLAACVCGLYVSWNGPLLIPAATRLQGIFFWDLLIYVLEGALFLLTGLQARPLLERIVQVSGAELAVAALVTIVAVIAARFLWIYPAIYLPRWLVPSLRRNDPYPIWQRPFILSFTGVRGIVSLAAALALPLVTAAGEPFPHRDLILLLTFWVILVTLVGQGLLLPAVIGWLGLPKIAETEQLEERKAELAARRTAINAVLQTLDRLAQERNLPEALENAIRARYIERLNRAELADGEEDSRTLVDLHDEIEKLLIDTERRYIFGQLERGELIDEGRRRIEWELDLRETHLQRNTFGASDPED